MVWIFLRARCCVCERTDQCWTGRGCTIGLRNTHRTRQNSGAPGQRRNWNFHAGVGIRITRFKQAASPGQHRASIPGRRATSPTRRSAIAARRLTLANQRTFAATAVGIGLTVFATRDTNLEAIARAVNAATGIGRTIPHGPAIGQRKKLQADRQSCALAAKKLIKGTGNGIPLGCTGRCLLFHRTRGVHHHHQIHGQRLRSNRGSAA